MLFNEFNVLSLKYEDILGRTKSMAKVNISEIEWHIISYHNKGGWFAGQKLEDANNTDIKDGLSY